MVSKTVGITIKLLYEAIGQVITIEMLNGVIYSGTLEEVEDSFNIILSNATKKEYGFPDKSIKEIYIKSSQQLFISIPSMFQHSAIFQRNESEVNKGINRGVAPPITKAAATSRVRRR